jgi:uncharacterized membrane protein YdfJ with MMPL/SSD domain
MEYSATSLHRGPIIKSIGFALAFGVFFDVFVVRVALVPAVMALIGRCA